MDLLSVCFVGFLKVFVSVCVFWVVVESVWAGLFAADFPPHHVGRTCHAAEIAAADTAVGPGKPAPAIPADNVSQPVAANNAFWALNKRPEALPRGIIGAQCRV